MKQYTFILFIVAAFANGCQSGEHHHTEASHSHHDHADKDAHEGHDHSTGHDSHAEASHDHAEASHEHADEIVFTEAQAKAVGLETEEVRPGAFSQVIKTGGQIRASQGNESAIAATVSGIVSFAEASLTEGAPIKAGETVAVISSKNMADGDLQVKIQTEYETALKAYQRAETLVKDKIISAKDFEETRLRYETARAAYEAQSSRRTAEGVRLTSPVKGYVKNCPVGQGEYVVAGQTVAVITQNKRLQLRAEVPESHFKALKNVNSAHFKLSYDEAVYKLSMMNGRLLSVGQTSGESSYYIPVTFEFDNTGEILPGAYCEVYLLTAPDEGVISVPLQAVTEEQGLYFVYLRIEQDAYRKQEINTGMSDGERVQALSGLQSGDRVVTKGAYQVKLAANAGIIPEGHSHNH
ncbi:MAG: efflux RND transporter periplasmic adaptor subunit [Tannerella sp.]|jgi:RND family efflux transporter MFP subunit|nr:efflux RND transporter periplasmic adaptor subunit [Tannerella sp.]